MVAIYYLTGKLSKTNYLTIFIMECSNKNAAPKDGSIFFEPSSYVSCPSSFLARSINCSGSFASLSEGM
jgi:hypothetical protein